MIVRKFPNTRVTSKLTARQSIPPRKVAQSAKRKTNREPTSIKILSSLRSREKVVGASRGRD